MANSRGGIAWATACKPWAGEGTGEEGTTRGRGPAYLGASSIIRKNVIICCSDSAWAASSYAVADSSSAAEALRCVTWSTCTIARLICTTPLACSLDNAATCCTLSAVVRM